MVSKDTIASMAASLNFQPSYEALLVLCHNLLERQERFSLRKGKVSMKRESLRQLEEKRDHWVETAAGRY